MTFAFGGQTPTLEVSALHVSIGAIEIIRDAQLSLGERQFSGLIGRNGAGKTTLMRALMGALPARGIMTLDGADLLAEPAHIARPRVRRVVAQRGAR